MNNISWREILGIVLGGAGLYILARGFQRYLGHVVRDPSHELGIMAEIVFFGYLVVGTAVAAVGIRSYRTERIALPMAAIMFGLVVRLESATDWLLWRNTQVDLLILLLSAGTPAVLTWLICRYLVRSDKNP